MLEGCHEPLPVRLKDLVEAKASLLGRCADTVGEAGWLISFWFTHKVRAHGVNLVKVLVMWHEDDMVQPLLGSRTAFIRLVLSELSMGRGWYMARSALIRFIHPACARCAQEWWEIKWPRH